MIALRSSRALSALSSVQRRMMMRSSFSTVRSPSQLHFGVSTPVLSLPHSNKNKNVAALVCNNANPISCTLGGRFRQEQLRCCTAIAQFSTSIHVDSSDSEATDATHNTQLNLLSSSKNIRIYWGSQTGTAQWFAQDLQQRIQDQYPDSHVTVNGLQDFMKQQKPRSDQDDGTVFHIFLISVTGIGEPPDNARQFYQHIMGTDGKDGVDGDKDGDGQAAAASFQKAFQNQPYAVFGLGNAQAHPNHYNVIGKALDDRIQNHFGGIRVLPIGLGDDGGISIEADFDAWVDALCERIGTADSLASDNDADHHHDEDGSNDDSAASSVVVYPTISFIQQDDAVPKSNPATFLQQQMALLDETVESGKSSSRESSFYATNTQLMSVSQNLLLNPLSGESGLREMRLQLSSSSTLPDDKKLYDAGDHVLVYPENGKCVVQAFMKLLTDHWRMEIPANATLQIDSGHATKIRYPHPTGISLMDTLTHCVDLGAAPTPAMVRMVLNKSSVPTPPAADEDFDAYYEHNILGPQRTVLDLLLQEYNDVTLTTEELLYNLPRMKPRYYSIASSPLESSNELVLTYRPIKYVTSRGALRQGVATNYLTNLGAAGHGEQQQQQQVPIKIISNPAFRLPKSIATKPIVMIAGGCGIAPIRAFLMHMMLDDVAPIERTKKNRLYIGFRSSSDQVYYDLIQSSIQNGVLESAKISYFDSNTNTTTNNRHQQQTMIDDGTINNKTTTTITEHPCCYVSDLLQQDEKWIWEHIHHNGGYIYICGGAKTFGAAIEKELLHIIEKYNTDDNTSPNDYLKQLIESRRLCQDLSD